MKKIEETIKETFEFIPDSLFKYAKNSQESIYINLEKLGYKYDWTDKVFKNGSGKIIEHYEIKYEDIKATKAETLDHILSLLGNTNERLRAFLASVKEYCGRSV